MIQGSSWRFLQAVFVLFILVIMTTVGISLSKQGEESWPTSKYHRYWKAPDYELHEFRIKKYQDSLDFEKQIMEFAKEQEVYDITYHKTKAVVTVGGYVVTRRYPNVIFASDRKSALVWWFKGMKKFPKKYEELKQKDKK